MDLLRSVQVLEPFENLPQNDRNVNLVEGAGPHLHRALAVSGTHPPVTVQQSAPGGAQQHATSGRARSRRRGSRNGPRTKSSAEPPFRYSIVIHKCVPFK